MALRPALILLSAVAAASFTAAWATGLVAKTSSTEAKTPVQTYTLITSPSETPTATNTQLPALTTPVAAAAPEDPTFKTKILPLLQKYCVECHKGDKPKGGVTLDAYQSEAHARKDRKNWHTIQHVVAAGDMPPPKS